MSRARLGVVLLLPHPLEREVDTLRRACGDGTYGRVPAHVTLVPPVNVNEERLDDAVGVMREAAALSRPFTVHLGPPATFLPANPVLYLPLIGPGRAEVFELRERVFREPLARTVDWPFVPHVTVADEAQPDRIAAAEVALAGYCAELSVDRLHLLREGAGRVWAPIADAPFAVPAVIGRGGLPLELTVTAGLDPESRAFLEAESEAAGGSGDGPDAPNLAVLGRREGRLVGVAEGWARDGVACVTTLMVAHDTRRQGIGSHVLAAFESAARERGCDRLAATAWEDTPGEAFFRSKGWVEESRLSSWRGGRNLVQLRCHR